MVKFCWWSLSSTDGVASAECMALSVTATRVRQSGQVGQILRCELASLPSRFQACISSTASLLSSSCPSPLANHRPHTLVALWHLLTSPHPLVVLPHALPLLPLLTPPPLMSPQGEVELRTEDVIPNAPSLVVYSRRGYIKRMRPESFGAQKRGGMGGWGGWCFVLVGAVWLGGCWAGGLLGAAWFGGCWAMRRLRGVARAAEC